MTPHKPMSLRFHAVDTWFFRDARPYNQGDPGQMNIGNLFPPSVRTLVGATRSAMARRLGWDGHTKWDARLQEQLGNSDVMAPLAFRGPLLMEGGSLLFPLPLNILGKQDGERFIPQTRLEPGDPVHCDLGCKVRLARPKDKDVEGLKLNEDAWVTAAAFEHILQGDLPPAEALRDPKQLFTKEPRIGIARDSRSHTVAEGMLYSTQHIRPKPHIALTLEATGWTGGPMEELIPMGGDGRQAFCTSGEPWNLPRCSVQDGATTAAIYFVTPAHISPTLLKPISGTKRETLKIQDLEDLELVAACVGKPQRVGGWDVAKRRPVAVGTLLAPGAVLYVQGSPERIHRLKTEQHGATVGERSDWGYGMILVGAWNDPQS